MRKISVAYSEETSGTCECGRKIAEDGYCEKCDAEGSNHKYIDILSTTLFLSIAPLLMTILYWTTSV